MLKGEKVLTGWLFFIGILVMSITSRCFDNIPGMMAEDYTVRDCIVMVGQDLGELIWCFAFWFLLKDLRLFLAVVEFTMALLLIDLVMILFFNPYKPSWHKDTGIIISLSYVLINTKRYLR